MSITRMAPLTTRSGATGPHAAYLLSLAAPVILLVPLLQWLLSPRLAMPPWLPNVPQLLFIATFVTMISAAIAFGVFRGAALRVAALMNALATALLFGLMLHFQPPFPLGIGAYASDAAAGIASGFATLLLGAASYALLPRGR
jgi:hypothetical protein